MIMPAKAGSMNNEELDSLIREIGGEIEGPMGFWQFTAFGMQLYCITDESHDRLRIMTPIADVNTIEHELITACMEANFDRALDARYCINDGTLWAHTSIRSVCSTRINSAPPVARSLSCPETSAQLFPAESSASVVELVLPLHPSHFDHLVIGGVAAQTCIHSHRSRTVVPENNRLRRLDIVPQEVTRQKQPLLACFTRDNLP